MNQKPQSPEKPDNQTEKPVKGRIPAPGMAPEIGGRQGPEPTRYNDWENNGKCVDF